MHLSDLLECVCIFINLCLFQDCEMENQCISHHWMRRKSRQAAISQGLNQHTHRIGKDSSSVLKSCHFESFHCLKSVLATYI